MLERTISVIKNKNRLEKIRRAKKRDEINSIRVTSVFKAKLYEELKHIDIILNDNNIDAVVVTVPDTYLAQFSYSIYTEDLAGYKVEQLDGEPNKFYIMRKYIAF